MHGETVKLYCYV